MLKKVYVIISELHTDGQNINLNVIRNAVSNSRISDKGEATKTLYKWAVKDGMVK